MRRGAALALVLLLAVPAGAQELSVQFVGNEGVVLSDGETSLLVDLPYRSGAYGYEEYDPAALQPEGRVISVVTHHHVDHFDPQIFLAREGWEFFGPPSAAAVLPRARVLPGDTLEAGGFRVEAIPTEHTPDHRSYVVEWGGRRLVFVGDTNDPSFLSGLPPVDVLFVSPWLACAMVEAGIAMDLGRGIYYHRRADGSDRWCGGFEQLEQGAGFVLEPVASEG